MLLLRFNAFLVYYKKNYTCEIYVIRAYIGTFFLKIIQSSYIFFLFNLQLQNYLAISKLIPFLVKLESTIDAYISTVAISPIDKFKCSKLDVFAIVTKLLTGELLDNEPMDPYHVLMDNAPKKPVFIIKTKRKSDIPISIIETT